MTALRFETPTGVFQFEAPDIVSHQDYKYAVSLLGTFLSKIREENGLHLHSVHPMADPGLPAGNYPDASDGILRAGDDPWHEDLIALDARRAKAGFAPTPKIDPEEDIPF